MLDKIPKLDSQVIIATTILSLFAVLGGFIATVEIAKLPFMLLFCVVYGVFSLALVHMISKRKETFKEI